MKKIKKYIDYTTENPMMLPINEGRGIPNILKKILNDIFEDVLYKIENPTKPILLDFGFGKFNIKNLHINITNRVISEIYATSSFGIYDGTYLKSPIIDIHLDYNNFDKLDLKRVILHELLHIYEIFNRIKGETKKDLQWGLNKVLLDIRKNYSDDKFISDFIYLIYLSLDQEINSRVAETYILLMEINSDDKILLIDELKKTPSWKYKKYLEEFDYKKYKISTERLNEFFEELSDKILSKYNVDFNLYKNPTINNWIVLFRKKSKYFEKKLMKLIDEVINDVNMIDTSYVDIDDNEGLSEKYITKYDVNLEKKSLNFKKNRE